MPHGENVILCVECREEVSTSQLNDLRGISNNERVDEALYQDTETTAQRKARPLRTVCTLNICNSTMRLRVCVIRCSTAQQGQQGILSSMR